MKLIHNLTTRPLTIQRIVMSKSPLSFALLGHVSSKSSVPKACRIYYFYLRYKH